MGEAERCVNTARPLTHSLDLGEEGIAVKATPAPVHDAHSPRWRGNPRQYQIEAQRLYALHFDRAVLPWSWVTTDCEVEQCLDPECMTVRAAKRIKYPAETCVYCGEPGYSRDHLLPRPLTGDALRHMVVVVPACRLCNSLISDMPTPNVAERRRRAQLAIERRHKHLLLSPHKTASDLAELGPTLRSVAVKNNILRERVKGRLGWPVDPYYDLRAFQRSGIPDPESLGLCELESKPLRPEYAREDIA
jgi:hypothetical protein